ncbi:hypothetical protein GWI33_003846, partial [Rhynchophorus ferrugineus]
MQIVPASNHLTSRPVNKLPAPTRLIDDRGSDRERLKKKRGGYAHYISS